MKKNENKKLNKDFVNSYILKIKNLRDYIKRKEAIAKKPVYATNTYKKYMRLATESITKNVSEIINPVKLFNHVRSMKIGLVFLYLLLIIISIVIIITEYIEKDNFRAISTIYETYISDKNNVVSVATNELKNAHIKNLILEESNLNMAKIYEEILDEEEKKYKNATNPEPVYLDVDSTLEVNNNKNDPMKSVAGQVFTKLMNKYNLLMNSIYNLSDTKPVNIVRQYHYDGYSILGDYDPTNKSHKKDKKNTFFIENFTNVNTIFHNGDGEVIDEYNNIKDIMSMASIYTYFHDPYDKELFLNYCYELFDKSITYTPKIGPLYHCSGCMKVDDEELVNSYLSKNKYIIKNELVEQQRKIVDVKKSGILTRMDKNKYTVAYGDYNTYIDSILSNERKEYKYNYCPGHIDLIVDVKTLCFNDKKGLISIDEYGNRARYWNSNWRGWDLLKKAKVNVLANKDWEQEYGLSISYANKMKPLTQEEINYYLSRLDKDISEDRYNLIKTALNSVGRIPYYYAGKPKSKGLVNNEFGIKIKPDYKGRILNGLDCSGWITWVYWTTFDKRIIRTEGTSKLATEGTKIRRYELQPGDIIVRPGYDSHVMMFFEWEKNGSMRVIHENGSVNNVSVGVVEGYFPFYRRILKN